MEEWVFQTSLNEKGSWRSGVFEEEMKLGRDSEESTLFSPGTKEEGRLNGSRICDPLLPWDSQPMIRK